MIAPVLLSFVMTNALAPNEPIEWGSYGRAEAAKVAHALHIALKGDKVLSQEAIDQLPEEDRTYFHARQLLKTVSLAKSHTFIGGLRSPELQADIRGRWLEAFADTKDPISPKLWTLFEDELRAAKGQLHSGLNSALRRFALERPSQALRCYEDLLKGIEDGAAAEAQLTYMAIVALLELKPVNQQKLQAFRETLYTAHPLHALTPRRPPSGVSFGAQPWLRRIEALIEGHLNERGLEELNRFKKNRKLTEAQACRVHFLEGLAHRKMRKYTSAEAALEKAANQCRDEDYKRRGHYLWAKVVSIRDGLEAIAPIESFVSRFPQHSMTDDVLFWAGDVYQRRERWAEADVYYEKVQRPEYRGDYCAEARWRRAWMSFVNEDWSSAETKLRAALQQDCAVDAQALARAEYWLGVVQLKLGNQVEALAVWERLVQRSPLSFYSQIAMGRVTTLAPSKRLAWGQFLPQQDSKVAFCPGSLATNPEFRASLKWLERGHLNLAQRKLGKIDWDAAILGEGPGCAVRHPDIVEAFGYRQMGDDDRGYRILRTLWKDPAAQSELIANKRYLKLLYPDLYSDILATSERTYGLPSYFLQALAREESSFHPEIASWAGARGLLQLMPGTAKRIAKRAKVKYRGEGDLLDPVINASLGGALMRELSRKFKGDPASMLAGYNASQKASSAWRTRYLEKDIDHMIENITVKETRKYVKRVLETWGIYKWLYGNTSIALKPWQVGEPLTWEKGR